LHSTIHHSFYTIAGILESTNCIRDGFSLFRSGVDKYLGGELLLALAGAWWQRPERPSKNFNKICFLGLHGEI
jgi:hypothetical protein